MLKRSDVYSMTTNTTEIFGDTWKRNIITNRGYEDLRFGEIEGSWRGFDTVLVGAGPSLVGQIDQLKALDRSKVRIVAVDVMVKYLAKNGIVPDVVCVVDCQNTAERIYLCKDGKPVADFSNTTLAATGNSNPTIWRHWPGRRLMYFIKDSDGNHVEYEKMNPHVEQLLASGGNVLTNGFSLASDVYECRRLFLIGCDHCWDIGGPGMAGRTGDDAPPRLMKLAKKYFKKHGGTVMGPQYQVVKDINGKLVWTSKEYIFYAQWLDSVSKTTRKSVYDLTPAGLIGDGNIKKVPFSCLTDEIKPTDQDLMYWYDMGCKHTEPEETEIVEVAGALDYQLKELEWTPELEKAQVCKWSDEMNSDPKQRYTRIFLNTDVILNGGPNIREGAKWNRKKLDAWVIREFLEGKGGVSEISKYKPERIHT